MPSPIRFPNPANATKIPNPMPAKPPTSFSGSLKGRPMPQPDWQSIENLAYQIIVDAVHSIRRQHPRQTVYAAIFHNFYCDNTYLSFPSLSVGTEELLARVVEKYQNEYGSAESRAELEQSLRWSGADLAEYLFDSGAAGGQCGGTKRAGCRAPGSRLGRLIRPLPPMFSARLPPCHRRFAARQARRPQFCRRCLR